MEISTKNAAKLSFLIFLPSFIMQFLALGLIHYFGLESTFGIVDVILNCLLIMVVTFYVFKNNNTILLNGVNSLDKVFKFAQFIAIVIIFCSLLFFKPIGDLVYFATYWYSWSACYMFGHKILPKRFKQELLKQ